MRERGVSRHRLAAALGAGALGVISESTLLEALLRTVRTAAAEHQMPVRA